MKKSKNKFFYLLVGIFIGFFIVWSITWWQGYNTTGKWRVIKKVKSYFSSFFNKNDNQNVTIITENAGKQKTDNKRVNKPNPELKNDSAYYDTTNLNLYDPNALDEFLARYNGQLPDSLVLDSILKNQNNIDINTYSASDNIPIKKDQLIYAKSFTIPGIDQFNNDDPDKIDSLLTDNKANTLNKFKNMFSVEFWKSPINYKGYKTGKNKLVLFGIDQFNMISFKMLNKTLYMKYISDYYQVDKTSEFKSLVSVNNQNIINQLNSK
ncbi:MAG: hypothetical protein WC868_08635 [Bacteroidales bacterium]